MVPRRVTEPAGDELPGRSRRLKLARPLPNIAATAPPVESGRMTGGAVAQGPTTRGPAVFVRLSGCLSLDVGCLSPGV